MIIGQAVIIAEADGQPTKYWRKHKMVKSTGTVTMSLAEYNDLYNEASKAQRLFKAVSRYSGLEIEMDKEEAYKMGVQLVKNYVESDKYSIKPFDEFYWHSTTIATEIKKEDTEI